MKCMKAESTKGFKYRVKKKITERWEIQNFG